MVKSDLRQNNFFETAKYPKKTGVNLTWVITAAILIAVTYAAVFYIVYVLMGFVSGGPTTYDFFIYVIESINITGEPMTGYFIFMILVMFAYLFLKLFMTILLSHQAGTIKLKLLEHKGIPVCSSREAFTAGQTVTIYLTPVVLIYSFYMFLCMRYQANPYFILTFSFMLFFMSFDLTLIIYVIAFKIKYNIDYISIDYHIYDVTLYKKTYIRARRKAPSRFLIQMSEKNIENGKFNWK